MEIYLKLFEVVFPVFFIVGIGYYIGKKDKKFDTTFITNFASNIGTPAMVIYAITSTGINFQIFKDYFFFYLLAILGFIILGIIILFMLNTKDIIRELPPLILPNTGNMGIPICLFAYGAQGLGVAAAISSLIVLLHFTLGIFLADRKFNFTVLIKSPPFYAILISVLFLYFEINMPQVVINLTELLTFATIFLILMSLGIALTKLKVFSLKNAIFASVGRVILGPLIGFLIIIYSLFPAVLLSSQEILTTNTYSSSFRSSNFEKDIVYSLNIDIDGSVNLNSFEGSGYIIDIQNRPGNIGFPEAVESNLEIHDPFNLEK